MHVPIKDDHHRTVELLQSKKGTMKARPKKGTLAQTAEEYASRTTIHGIGYIVDGRLGPLDRLLWALLVLAFLALATVLTWNTWTKWQNNQVTNNIKHSASVFILILTP